MKCPKCGNTDWIFTTCLGIIAVGKPEKDVNWASCPCGHRARAWTFGAPDIQPVKGSENWADKQVKEFWENPVKLKGTGYFNPAGIKQVKFDKDTISKLPRHKVIITEFDSDEYDKSQTME